MISAEWKEGDRAYVPFWVLLDVLDASYPHPFIEVTIDAVKQCDLNSPSGLVKSITCDIQIKPGLTADNVPVNYLIKLADLGIWADRIASWFKNFPNQISSQHT